MLAHIFCRVELFREDEFSKKIIPCTIFEGLIEPLSSIIKC